VAVLTAYILIDTHVGAIAKVVNSLQALQEVQYAYRVTGPYDVIAKVETVDHVALGGLLHDRVDAIEGISRTITCVVMP